MLKASYNNQGRCSFSNLTFSVRLRGGGSKVILDGLTGSFIPGTATALMGPSGSGKSTLFDILSERKNTGQVSGELSIVGRSRTGYVEQFDTVVGELGF